MMVETNIKELNNKYHFLAKECDVMPEKKGKLDNYTISLKDAILLKDVESTASSDILKSYYPVFNATVAKKILENGGRIIGKTTQDEFGFGTFCTNIGKNHQTPLNPKDTTRCVGGSSGGAAVAAKVLDNHISIAESTGGSIVTPAAFTGVVGLCPTYGRVSRNGLISYAASLDKIGVMSKKIKESALMLSIIAGKDEADETTSDEKIQDYEQFAKNPLKKIAQKKIGILTFEGIDDIIQKRTDDIIQKLKNEGMVAENIELPLTKKYALAAYYIIAMSEASTHLACLCGLRYGQSQEFEEKNYDDYFSDVRTKFFNTETKRRIMLGTFTRMSGYRGKYYMKALKTRKKIIDEYKNIFQEYDAIAMPTVPFFAPKFEEIDKLTPLQNYNSDFITVGQNLAGLPHVTIPIEKEKEIPHGIMFVADHFKEKELIELGATVEEVREK